MKTTNSENIQYLSGGQLVSMGRSLSYNERLQVKAMLGAISCHGASKFVHRWRLNFPRFAKKARTARSSSNYSSSCA